MADVIRMPVNVNSQAQCFSSSLLASFSSSKNSPQSSLPPKSASHKRVFSLSQFSSSSAADLLPCSHSRPRKQLLSFKMHATITETHQPKWWEKNVGPNMIDIHSTEEFFAALSHARDRLVIVEFYGTWCASCRALFPKLCRTAAGHPETLFLKVNFDENKSMCKQLNVKVLPYFHFYRGADKQLESFSCSLAKFQKIKDAIKLHTTAGCSLGTSKDTGSSSAE